MVASEPQTEDEIYKEARLQLAKLLIERPMTIPQLERESRDVSEVPIRRLADLAGFSSTKEFILVWFDDVIEWIPPDKVDYLEDLFDTPELKHILSLKQRTRPKNRPGRRGAPGGRGIRGGARGRGGRFPPPPRQYRVSPAPSASSSNSYRPQPSRASVNGRSFPPPSRLPANGRRTPPPPRPSANVRPVENFPRPSVNGRPIPLRELSTPLAQPPHNYDAPSPVLDRYSSRDSSPPRRTIIVDESSYEQISPEIIPNSTREHFSFNRDPYGVDTARIGGDYDEYRREQHYQEPHAPYYEDEYYPPEPHYDRQVPRRASPPYDPYGHHHVEGYTRQRNGYVPTHHYEGEWNDERILDASPLHYDERRSHQPPTRQYDERRNQQFPLLSYEDERIRRSPPLPYDDEGFRQTSPLHYDDRRTQQPSPSRQYVDEFYDASDNFVPPTTKFELDPIQYNPEFMRDYEVILTSKFSDELARNLQSPIQPITCKQSLYYSGSFLDYFVDVITDLYLMICNSKRSSVPFYETIVHLSRKTRQEPGYDDITIYAVMKALGEEFFIFSQNFDPEIGIFILRVSSRQKLDDSKFMSLVRQALAQVMPTLNLPPLTDERKMIKAVLYASKDEKYPYFVKLPSTGAQEKTLQAALSIAIYFDVNVVYPQMLCVYHLKGNPYRAQIVNLIDRENIEIELVDVGVFLTVCLSELKKVDSNDLIQQQRFALPCVLEGSAASQLRMEKASDGFDRMSTNKSIAMYIARKQDNNEKHFVSVKLP